MISTWLIKIIYALGALGLTIISIYFIFSIFSDSREKGLYFLVGIASITIGNLIWRVVCEMLILMFSIHDVLQSIEKK